MKVSINLATYNRLNQLRNTLDSIYRQLENGKTKSGHEVEVIVIDDGSDLTYQYIEHNYPEVICETTGHHNYDPASTFPNNRAAKISTGEIIIQGNAETFHWSLNTIDKLVAATGKKKAAFSTCFNLGTNPFEETLKYMESLNALPYSRMVHYCGRQREVAWFFCGAIRKEDWDSLGGYEGARPVDVNFALDMVEAGFEFEWLYDTFTIHQTHTKG